MDSTGSSGGEDFVVRVKHQQKLRFVRISNHELNITMFLQKGL